MTTVFTFEVDTLLEMFSGVVAQVVDMNDDSGRVGDLITANNVVTGAVYTVHVDVVEEEIDPANLEELVDVLEWRLSDMLAEICDRLDNIDPARELAFVDLAPSNLEDKFKWCYENMFSYWEGVELYGNPNSQPLDNYLDGVISAYILSQVEHDLGKVKDTLAYSSERDIEDMARALAEQKFENEGDK